MDRTERFYKIDQLLNEQRLVSFAQLREALEVSPATLKRDLSYLRLRLNAPIVYDRDAGGYRFATPDRDAPKYELPGLWFNASEIYALLTMQNLLEEVQPGLLGQHIAPLQSRLRSLLGSQDDAPEEVSRRIRLLHVAKRKSELRFFEPIAAALLKRKRLRIRHYHRGRDAETAREVSPQRLVWYRDNWYLDAWCHLREGVRSFSVDTMRAVSIEETRAKSVPEKELDAALGAGYGIFGGTQVRWASLRFSAERARWVAAEEWHPQQRSRLDAAGRYVLEVPYASDTELLMDILRHLPEVEVMAPAALRQRVFEIAGAARTMHEN